MHDLTSPSKRQRLNPESPTSHLSNPSAEDVANQALNNQTIVASVLYVPGAQFPPLGRYLHRLIEVRIPSKYLYAKNKEIINRSIWGSNNQYTDDSDVIVCLQHSGKYILRNITPDPRGSQDVNSNSGLSVILRVSPALAAGYSGSESNGVRSRSWKSKYHRYTISVVSVEHTDHVNTPSAHMHKSLANQANNSVLASPSLRSSKQEPRQLKMVIVDRGFGMYGPGRVVSKQQRRSAPVDVTLRFSHNHTMWLAYGLTAILDRGLDESTWTATRLRYQALELESVSQNQRMRITIHDQSVVREHIHPIVPSISAMLFSPPPAKQEPAFDRYDVHLVDANSDARKPRKSTPLVTNVDWDDFQWSSESLSIKGTVYPIDVYRWTPIDFASYQDPNVIPSTQ